MLIFNNIIFTIKDAKLYKPVVTLTANVKQKLSKLFSKDFKRSVYWNEYNQEKIANKNKTNKYWYFLDAVNKLFLLVYSSPDDDTEKCKAKKYYLTKVSIKNYNIIINGKTFYDQWINFDIKRYEQIRRLTTGQGKQYTGGCYLYHEYIKNHYRLLAVDLSRRKDVDPNPKAIKQTDIVGQLKNI